jgi:hypothetical protein
MEDVLAQGWLNCSWKLCWIFVSALVKGLLDGCFVGAAEKGLFDGTFVGLNVGLVGLLVTLMASYYLSKTTNNIILFPLWRVLANWFGWCGCSHVAIGCGAYGLERSSLRLRVRIKDDRCNQRLTIRSIRRILEPNPRPSHSFITGENLPNIESEGYSLSCCCYVYKKMK